MTYKEFTGTYGSGNTETTVYTATDSKGATWYACDGSLNVNRTYDEVADGVNAEELSDFDMFTASKPVESLEDLEGKINEEEEEEEADEPEEEEVNPVEIWETYEFNDISEFYNYIVESEINGNRTQVRNLIAECSPEQVKDFINYIGSGEFWGTDNQDAKICKNIALDDLTARSQK